MKCYPALRYSLRSLKNEPVADCACAFAFPFSAFGFPIVKLSQIGVVPSDDPDPVQVVSVEERFALAASMDLAIAASIGLMCSDAFVLLFIVLTPFVGLGLLDYRPKIWTTFVPFQKV